METRYKELSRFIRSLMKNQRPDHITKLLIETNLSISQIAQELGYTSAEHIARYFRRVKGMSPSEFKGKREFVEAHNRFFKRSGGF